MTPDDLQKLLSERARESFTARVLPAERNAAEGLLWIEVEMPLYTADGDGVAVFVRPATKAGEVEVSDLSMLVFQFEYTGGLSPDEEKRIAELAEAYGVTFAKGALLDVVPETAVVSTCLRIASVQIAAHTLLRGMRQP
jgi:hypothetical protein